MTLLPAATPETEPKSAVTIDQQKTAASQPAVTENYLEVASFNDSNWADRAVDQLIQLGFHAVAIHKTRLWMQSYHVRVGPYTNAPDMEAAEKSLNLVASGQKARGKEELEAALHLKLDSDRHSLS